MDEVLGVFNRTCAEFPASFAPGRFKKGFLCFLLLFFHVNNTYALAPQSMLGSEIYKNFEQEIKEKSEPKKVREKLDIGNWNLFADEADKVNVSGLFDFNANEDEELSDDSDLFDLETEEGRMAQQRVDKLIAGVDEDCIKAEQTESGGIPLKRRNSKCLEKGLAKKTRIGLVGVLKRPGINSRDLDKENLINGVKRRKISKKVQEKRGVLKRRFMELSGIKYSKDVKRQKIRVGKGLFYADILKSFKTKEKAAKKETKEIKAYCSQTPVVRLKGFTYKSPDVIRIKKSKGSNDLEYSLDAIPGKRIMMRDVLPDDEVKNKYKMFKKIGTNLSSFNFGIFDENLTSGQKILLLALRIREIAGVYRDKEVNFTYDIIDKMDAFGEYEGYDNEGNIKIFYSILGEDTQRLRINDDNIRKIFANLFEVIIKEEEIRTMNYQEQCAAIAWLQTAKINKTDFSSFNSEIALLEENRDLYVEFQACLRVLSYNRLLDQMERLGVNWDDFVAGRDLLADKGILKSKDTSIYNITGVRADELLDRDDFVNNQRTITSA